MQGNPIIVFLKRKKIKYGQRVAVVHFNPIDKYPPAVNLVRYLAGQKDGKSGIYVITTRAENTHWHLKIPGVIINQLVFFNSKLGKGQRILKYIAFNLKALYRLYLFRPDTVLYYETLSAWAPGIYIKWINTSARLFIHYHEYTSPEEYKSEMILNRWLHRMEKDIYMGAAWISHTNQDRMLMFLNDIKPVCPENTHILPNYPPASWQTRLRINKTDESRIGFVYVGALSLDTMYTKEMAEFIAANSDKYYWHIYSDTFDKNVTGFLQTLGAENISFKGPVKYDDIPEILNQYDIGVILYKGHIPNYIYNAPNKLFEYHACGLSVWFPLEMKGAYPYICEDKNPGILAIDFGNLAGLHSDKILYRPSVPEPDYKLSAEEVLKDLRNEIQIES